MVAGTVRGSKGKARGYINLGLSIIYPRKYAKEAVEHRNLELNGEVRAGVCKFDSHLVITNI